MLEQEFRIRLEQLVAIAKEQGMMLDESQISMTFPELAEDADKVSYLKEYLKSKKIGIDQKADLNEFLSMEDRNFLKDYMESLEEVTKTGEEKLREITLSAMTGDKNAQERILSLYLPKTVEIAKLYAGQGTLVEDLIGEGNLALTGAIYKLEELSDWTEAEGYLGKVMMDAMEDFIRGEVKEKELDEILLKRVNRVLEITKQLTEERNRKVSPEEICSACELTLDEVIEAIRISAEHIEGIEYHAADE